MRPPAAARCLPLIAAGALALAAALALPGAAACQSPPAGGPPDAPAPPADDGDGFRLLGRAPGRRRLIPGMWALHPFEPQFPEADWTRGGGAQASSWFGAVFMNSYDELSVIAGVERKWGELPTRWVDFGLGYRVGLITGYDERLFELAGKVPAVPFGGILVWAQAGRVGLDAFYVYRAISIEASLGF